MTQYLTVVATITANPGAEATVRAALERIVPPSRAEAGCARYELHVDNASPGRFVMLEEWADQDTLTRHEATPHFQALVAAIGGQADVHRQADEARLTEYRRARVHLGVSPVFGHGLGSRRHGSGRVRFRG